MQFQTYNLNFVFNSKLLQTSNTLYNVFSIVQVIVSDSLLNSQIVCNILSTYKTYQIIDLVLFIF